MSPAEQTVITGHGGSDCAMAMGRTNKGETHRGARLGATQPGGMAPGLMQRECISPRLEGQLLAPGT